MSLVSVVVVSVLFWLVAGIPWLAADTFYDLISHTVLVLIFWSLVPRPITYSVYRPWPVLENGKRGTDHPTATS